MRPTIRSLTVSFTLLLGLVTYAMANTDTNRESGAAVNQVVLASK